MTPSVLIVGAGAIGSYMALQMTRAGLAPALVARGNRLDRLQRDGLASEADGAVHHTRVIARDWADLSGPFDVIAICTKTCHFGECLHRLEGHVAPGTVLLTVQNGVDAPQQAASAFPQATVIASRVHGFFQFDNAVLRHVGVEPSVLMGLVRGADPAALPRLAGLLGTAGIPWTLSDDIVRDLWEKLLLAAPLGGVGAALGIAAGQVLPDPAGRELLGVAMAEVDRLARARGVALPAGCVDRTLAFVAGFPADATTSLQRDLAAGQPSEYGSLVGAVLRMGREAGLSLPAFTDIDRRIRQRFPTLA